MGQKGEAAAPWCTGRFFQKEEWKEVFCIYWAKKIRASLARCSGGIRFLCFFEKAASFPGGSENRRERQLAGKSSEPLSSLRILKPAFSKWQSANIGGNFSAPLPPTRPKRHSRSARLLWLYFRNGDRSNKDHQADEFPVLRFSRRRTSSSRTSRADPF